MKNKGSTRGGSLSNPGEYHSPLLHNMITNPVEDELRVTSDMAEHYRVWASDE